MQMNFQTMHSCSCICNRKRVFHIDNTRNKWSNHRVAWNNIYATLSSLETLFNDHASFGFRRGILIEQTLAANLWAPRIFLAKKGPRHPLRLFAPSPLRPISRIRCKITRRLAKLGWHRCLNWWFAMFSQVANFEAQQYWIVDFSTKFHAQQLTTLA